MSRFTPEGMAANDKLAAAVQTWLTEFLGDELPPTAFLDDWMMVCSVEDPEQPDQTAYFRASAGGGMPSHRAIGLLHYNLNEYLRRD